MTVRCHDCAQPLTLPSARCMVIQTKKHGGLWGDPELKWFCAPSCNKRVVRGDRQ